MKKIIISEQILCGIIMGVILELDLDYKNSTDPKHSDENIQDDLDSAIWEVLRAEPNDYGDYILDLEDLEYKFET